MWKCPKCENKIDSLDYDVPTTGTEWGTAYLSDKEPENPNNSDHVISEHDYSDSGDSNWEGDVTYRCRECDEDVELQDLEWVEEDDEEEEDKPGEPEETKHEIITPKNNIVVNSNSNQNQTLSSIVCKNCQYLYVAEGGTSNWNNSFESNSTSECPKCGESNSTKEFRESLKDN